MREKIIKSLELIIWAFGILIVLAGLISGIAALASGNIGAGLLFIIGAPLYAILVLGMFFVILATQENTKRTAEAVEKLAER